LRVLLAGATGLVGHLLLRRLEVMSGVTAIDTVGRSEINGASTKTNQHLGPVGDWPTLVARLSPDVAISTLGTTMRQAGSEEAFFAVDHDAVVAVARAAAGAGSKRFLMVSSAGAHAASRNFYLATKGKAEAAAQSAGFERIDIFRPGLLRGNRSGERRIGERIGIAISPITDFLTPRVLDHYRSIAADDVAESIAAFLQQNEPGTYTHENRDMWNVIASR
jgi:uncharacterized protein YbjT (DUF2867 family)